MIHSITQGAHRLDHWLQERLGRPYRMILSIGLVIEILRRLTELPHSLGEVRGVVGAAAIIVLNLALLINQLGEMSIRMAGRRSGKGGRPGQRSGPGGSHEPTTPER